MNASLYAFSLAFDSERDNRFSLRCAGAVGITELPSLTLSLKIIRKTGESQTRL
jgi:hypothetical protein